MSWQEAAELYRAGASLRAVAEVMACDKKTARKHLARAGVEFRPKSVPAPAHLPERHPIRSMVSRGVWLERYVLQGESLTSLARWAGEVTGRSCCPEVIRKILQEYSIAIRTPAQQIRLDFRAGRLTPTRGHKGRPHSADTRARIGAAVSAARKKRKGKKAR